MHAAKISGTDVKRFYGGAEQLSLGTGVIIGEIPLPFFNVNASSYQIRETVALILTHECDISQENKRPNNSDVMLAPLIPLEDFFAALEGDRNIKSSYVGNVVSGSVSQLFYLPPWIKHQNGSIVYLNRISSTHISQLEREPVKKLIALSSFAHRKLCERLSDHLLRDKAEQLPPPA